MILIGVFSRHRKFKSSAKFNPTRRKDESSERSIDRSWHDLTSSLNPQKFLRKQLLPLYHRALRRKTIQGLHSATTILEILTRSRNGKRTDNIRDTRIKRDRENPPENVIRARRLAAETPPVSETRATNGPPAPPFLSK